MLLNICAILGGIKRTLDVLGTGTAACNWSFSNPPLLPSQLHVREVHALSDKQLVYTERALCIITLQQHNTIHGMIVTHPAQASKNKAQSAARQKIENSVHCTFIRDAKSDELRRLSALFLD